MYAERGHYKRLQAPGNLVICETIATEKRRLKVPLSESSRTEFGVIKFDNPISSGNTHGIVSTTFTSTDNYLSLPIGTHVTGEVQLESDSQKLAPITSIHSSAYPFYQHLEQVRDRIRSEIR
jgi:hypothetical protein